MYIAPSSGHILLNLELPFKLILRKFEGVFLMSEVRMLHFLKDSMDLINIFVILFFHIYCRLILHKRKKKPLHSGKMQKILKFKCSVDILLSFTFITLCWETIHNLTVLQYNVQIMHRLECEGLMKITCRGFGTVRTHKGQPCMFWPNFISKRVHTIPSMHEICLCTIYLNRHEKVWNLVYFPITNHSDFNHKYSVIFISCIRSNLCHGN